MTLLISRVLSILLALAVSVSAGDLDSQIKTLVETTPAARGALVGVLVVDLANGQTLAAHNPDHFFVPASNTKLFTTALALARLGSDYRFSTTVMSDRAPDASGTVGWLRLVGGGDPNLSNRTLPYQPGPSSGSPLQPIEELADQLVARGLRRVAGDVTGDDSAYVWAPYPEGWAVDDGIWDYGAPVNALVVNDNTFSLKVEPGARAGDPARLTPLPALEFYQIDNRVRTRSGGERKIWVDREPGARQLRVWGYIPLRDPGETEVLGIEDPAWYAARALIDALSRRGVAVGGAPQVRHLYPNQLADLRQGQPAAPDTAVELARRVSAPLLEDLRVVNKVSQNLHAEMALRAVGRAARGVGSREAGLEELKTFLDQAGIDRNAYVLNDGSGLTRLNLVTPAAVAKLLQYLYASSQRENWLSLLPLGGEDGTLRLRFADLAAAGARIRAKTGSLTHVTALSGYAERKDGRTLAFSILVNNHQSPTSEIRALIDRICMLMLE